MKKEMVLAIILATVGIIIALLFFVSRRKGTRLDRCANRYSENYSQVTNYGGDPNLFLHEYYNQLIFGIHAQWGWKKGFNIHMLILKNEGWINDIQYDCAFAQFYALEGS